MPFDTSTTSTASAATVVSTSMSSLFKPVFLATPGEAPIPWHRWISMFEDFIEASNFPANQEARKAALLRASLGAEGYRIYMTLSKGEKHEYAATVAMLKGYFDRRPTQIFERAKFAQRFQRSGESILEYVTALKEMAVKCGFADAQFDERMRDQFVPHLLSEKIKESLY